MKDRLHNSQTDISGLISMLLMINKCLIRPKIDLQVILHWLQVGTGESPDSNLIFWMFSFIMPDEPWPSYTLYYKCCTKSLAGYYIGKWAYLCPFVVEEACPREADTVTFLTQEGFFCPPLGKSVDVFQLFSVQRK